MYPATFLALPNPFHLTVMPDLQQVMVSDNEGKADAKSQGEDSHMLLLTPTGEINVPQHTGLHQSSAFSLQYHSVTAAAAICYEAQTHAHIPKRCPINISRKFNLHSGLALFDMPNSNRFYILLVSLFSEISLSISIFSNISLSISIYSRTALLISIFSG